MYLNEAYKKTGLQTSEPEHIVRFFRDGTKRDSQAKSILEHRMDVYINEELTMRLVCTADHLTELVVGRLLTEGIIEGPDDIEMLYICEFGKRARVTLRRKGAPISPEPGGGKAGTDQMGTRRVSSEASGPTASGSSASRLSADAEAAGSSYSAASSYVETTQTCCTMNHILNEYFVGHRELRPVTPIPWDAEWIYALADQFSVDTPLHASTGGTHSCMLARRGEILFTCEDIGRHNALDKAIGYALLQQIDLSECMLFSSGRLVTDMVEKVIRAGVPMIVSKAAASVEAVQLARDFRLTLAANTKENEFTLFCGNEPRQDLQE